MHKSVNVNSRRVYCFVQRYVHVQFEKMLLGLHQVVPVHTHPAKAERASFPRPSPAVSSNYNLCQSVRFLLLGGCASFHMFESFPFPLLQFSAHLYTGFIIFFLLICMSLLYIMEIRPFLRYELQIFSHSFSFVF